MRQPLKTDACFAFHHVNAYEDGDELIVDASVYPDASIVEDLYLDRLRARRRTPRRAAALPPAPTGGPVAHEPSDQTRRC